MNDNGQAPGIKKTVRTILFVGVVALLAALMVIYRVEIITAFSSHYPVLLFVAVIVVVSLALQAYNFLQLLGADRKIPFLPAWQTWATANIVNYLGPFQPGLAVRLAYFRSFGVPVIETTRTTLRQLVLSTWIASGLTVVGLASEDAGIRLFAAGGCLVFVLSPWIASGLRAAIPEGAGSSRIFTLIRPLLDLCRIDMPLFRLWPFVMQYILMALCLYAVYNEFGVRLEAEEAILLAVVFALSTLIAITPNNLGVQELLLGSVAYWGGMSGGEALAMALVIRVAHLVACAFVLLLTSRS